MKGKETTILNRNKLLLVGIVITITFVTVGVLLILTNKKVQTGGEDGNLVTTSYTNPVYYHDAADPSSVLKDEDGYYYIVTTQSNYTGTVKRLPIIRSLDLVNWELVGEVFSNTNLPDWTSKTNIHLWAPDLVKHEGKYYVYYSANVNDSEIEMAIGVAVADSITGPYVDKGEPIVTGPRFTTIDPYIFKDDDGKRYMYWGSGHEPLKVQELSNDGMSLVGERKQVLRPDPRRDYETLIEAPWVMKRGEYYYLFYSGNHGKNYAAMVARSTSPFGPFEKYWEKDASKRPIIEINERYYEPGHNSVVTDEAGQDWIVYHAYDNNAPYMNRMMMIDKLEWIDNWPVSDGPTFTLVEDGPVTKKPMNLEKEE